jgi:large subunit ribosomal protein L21e
MVRKDGLRGKTRSKFKKKGSDTTVNKLVQKFEENDTVQVVIDSSQHGGLPHRRFHGISGKIIGKRGSAYEVSLKKGNKKAIVVTTPAHIKKLETSSVNN